MQEIAPFVGCERSRLDERSGHRFAERKGVVASERDFAGAEKLHDVAQHPRVMDERIDEETAKIVAR